MSRLITFLNMRDELKKQGEMIKKAGGVVNIANDFPTLEEITAGIQTLSSVDFSTATATPGDVTNGKTFYAGNSILKTGTSLTDGNAINALFLNNANQKTYDDEVYYSFPDYFKKVRKYLFYQNIHTAHITFNSALTEIDDYGFYETKNFKFYGFSDLQNLTKVSAYAFTRSSGYGLDVARLPHSITTLNNYAFAYCDPQSLDYRYPSSLTSMGQSVYKHEFRLEVNSVDFSNVTLTTLSPYTFQNVGFNCDFTIPSNIKTIGMYFNNNGSFNNIVIPETCTSLETECFGSTPSYSNEYFRLRTITFESPTPPKFGSNVFAKQCVDNGFKIYVPDEAVEDYKAVSNISYFVDCIYPISQKE